MLSATSNATQDSKKIVPPVDLPSLHKQSNQYLCIVSKPIDLQPGCSLNQRKGQDDKPGSILTNTAKHRLSWIQKDHSLLPAVGSCTMLSEGFITSIRAQPKSADTGIVKDVGVYVHTIQPSPSIKATFKKSSTDPNCLAVSSTHIFAAQIDKAVVHIYSRDRGNQESLVSFPERIHSLVLVDDGVLVLGTAEGRLIIWEVSAPGYIA